MYNDMLAPKMVRLDQIHLDPNNPRFWSRRRQLIPDRRISDEEIQTRTFNEMSEAKYSVVQLRDSILQNGFLPLDRIVVRPLDDNDEQYVAVEGNRRITALKQIIRDFKNDMISEDDVSYEQQKRVVDKIESIEVLIYRGTDTREISWLLQGIRHIGGIKNWEPAQQARLLAEQIDNHGFKPSQAGQMFGLTSRQVGRLYRAFKGLEQMRADEEWRDKASNDMFSLFDEAHRNKAVRAWLDWDETDKIYRNQENARTFFKWISKNDDTGERILHDPKHVSILDALLRRDEDDLINRLDRYEIKIADAERMIENIPPAGDWERRVSQVVTILDGINTTLIRVDPMGFLSDLGRVENATQQLRTMAESLVLAMNDNG